MSVTQDTRSPEHVHHYDSSLNTTASENHIPCDEIGPTLRGGREINKSEYKPVPLRWPFLAAVLTSLVITLVLLTVAINTLPPMENYEKHLSKPVAPTKSTIQSIIPNGNVKGKAITPKSAKKSLSFQGNKTSPVLVSTITIVSKTYCVTFTEQGNHGWKDLESFAIIIAPESYGTFGYQTITTTATTANRETITKTVTETIREIIRDTITETMVLLPVSHGNFETISTPRSSIAVSTSVSRDIINVINKAITVSYIELGCLNMTGSYIGMGNSESANEAGNLFNVGEQTTPMKNVESQMPLPYPGSSETKVITENQLYYVGRRKVDIHDAVDPYTTETPVVLINPNGSPIATSMAQVSVATIEPHGDIIYIGDRIDTLKVTTSLNPGDSPIATITMPPNRIRPLATTTLNNTEGHPTATQVWTVTVTPSPSTATSNNEVPTATISNPPISPETYTIVYYIGPGEYVTGMFLPTIITSLIAMLVRIISTNVDYFQPWHLLSHFHGASGRDSLLLQPGGWRSILRSVRFVSSGEVVPFLANLLLILSAVLIPLSSEAISLDLRGKCANEVNTAKNCAWVLSASPLASGASIAILVLMALTLALLLGILKKWNLGVYTNPRSICTLASLSLNKEVQHLVTGTETPLRDQHHDLLECREFGLRHFQLITGKKEYGIVTLDEPKEVQSRHAHSSDNKVVPPTNKPKTNASSKRQSSGKPFTLGYLRRLSLLFIVCGVLGLVLYYLKTSSDTAFERFIDSGSFGVRFLFTSFGVAISFLWSSFFDSVAIMSPYSLLARKPQSANKSILLAPPTNPFSGLWYAARTRCPYFAMVCLASVSSEFLGIFLSNIPFQATQTFLVSRISIWISVGILSFMIIVIVESFFLKWPNMTANPRSISGAMYYISGSPMLEQFEGLSILGGKERDRKVMELDLLYELKENNYLGRVRMGINTSDRKVCMPLEV